MSSFPLFPLVVLLLLSSAASASSAIVGEEPYIFEARSGAAVEAFRGFFEVPENRGDPDSRMLRLGYVRFPATGETVGSPIVYLAGGPGGSGTGTASGRRFDLFMSMRQHGDVIAFDQRGTGLSRGTAPPCRHEAGGDPLRIATARGYANAYRDALRACDAYWRAQGADPQGYTTLESVADLSDLRTHLGAERIDLWGISYGTHLALAALKVIPDEIGRAVLASVEGLDQTVKLPARTDAYFARLQRAIDAQPAAAALYPDVAGLLRRVHARAEAEPFVILLEGTSGKAEEVLIHRHVLQQIAAGMISDPQAAAILLAVHAELDRGETGLLTAVAARFMSPEERIELRLMPIAMDVASGIGVERLALVTAQARTSLLGAQLNFPMPQVAGVREDLDLGDDFRTAPIASTPVLVLSGTLDGRTYPESQREAVAGLTDAHVVTVAGAGHNLFMTSQDVHALMHAFMRGERDLARRIDVEVPDLTALPF